MNIPIDLKAVFQEAMDVDAARSVPLIVSVLLDETAPADLVAFVRSSFASASPQARISINYFSNSNAVFDSKSDMVVIAAGLTEDVGFIARRVREASIPALVVTTLPEMVCEIAIASGHPIPEGDLAAPVIKDGDVLSLPEPVTISSDARYEGAGALNKQPDSFAALEPYTLNKYFTEQLSCRMGEWVVACFHTKRLAFAQAFDFVRRPLSMEALRSTSAQNAGVGLVAFIPGADLPIMTLNQAKMVLQIAAAYGQPLTLERAKELAAVVGGGFACRSAARQLVGVVPALGWVIKAGIGYAGTSAMGYAAIEYFERGGNAAGVAAVAAKAREAVIDAAEKTNVSPAIKETAQELGRQARDAIKYVLQSVSQLDSKKDTYAAPPAASTTASAAKNSHEN